MHPVSAEDGTALGNLIQFTTSTREASKMDPADIDEFLFAFAPYLQLEAGRFSHSNVVLCLV